MALALNNPGRLIYHWIKKLNQRKYCICVWYNLSFFCFFWGGGGLPLIPNFSQINMVLIFLWSFVLIYLYGKSFFFLSFFLFQLEYEQSREFSHLMWETHKVRVIKSGTLSKLVESLVTVKGEMDSCYVNVFLATYRTFATTQEVLNLLIER